MMEIVRNVLRTQTASSQQLRDALAAIDLAPLEAAVNSAERQRAGLLLDGSERQLDQADDVLKQAIRERDRAIAAQAELSARLAEASIVEAAAKLEAKRSAVEQEARAVAKLLSERFIAAQIEMVQILERLDAAEDAVAAINAEMVAAGRDDQLAAVETRAFPVPSNQFPGVYSIRNRTSLRGLPGARRWNDDAVDHLGV